MRTRKTKKLNSNPVFSQTPKTEKNEPLNLRLDPELGAQFGDQSVQLARGLEQNIDSGTVQKFLNILRSELPNELKSNFDNLTTKDIANIITFIVSVAILVGTGFGLALAVELICTRLALSSFVLSALDAVMTRPVLSSIMAGIFPKMKDIAPNRNISYAVSMMKDFVSFLLPGFTTQAMAKSKGNTKK